MGENDQIQDDHGIDSPFGEQEINAKKIPHQDPTNLNPSHTLEDGESSNNPCEKNDGLDDEGEKVKSLVNSVEVRDSDHSREESVHVVNSVDSQNSVPSKMIPDLNSDPIAPIQKLEFLNLIIRIVQL
ncbi:hypothetical protein L2E82_07824 [Cichorium intybus]|uniref:Uncharacterized protein n=1 Tax=Cichorium intybus TaxID=13427 RepID=A0ACB9G4Y4_CICIN|nr:hypothetical protein L2E82_07824 [Cichorium intybus]